DRQDPIEEAGGDLRESALQVGEEPEGAGPRGGVNGPALPGQRGRKSPLSIDPKLIISLAAVYVIWSSTYLAIRFVIAELPPLQGRPLHLVLVVLSPMCWALGSVLARRQSRAWRTGASLSSAMQMMTGGGALLVAGLVDGERLPAHASAGSWLAVGYLLVFG